MHCTAGPVSFWLSSWMISLGCLSAWEAPAAQKSAELSWAADYAQAMDTAHRQGKMMVIYFYDRGRSPADDGFERNVLTDPSVSQKLKDHVRVKLPTDAKILVQGKEVVLLEHPAFAEMQGHQGVVILDFAHKKADHYGCVVSAFPITGTLRYTAREMAVILDLPPGTLTQRTLIYAVRTHPDGPASTEGQISRELTLEAESHSDHQARIRRQGHHQWGHRFQRIIARLPAGMTASEVCAESWPGQNLVEAAIECVRSWRFSSGHWSAVRARHRFYGYDMKLGSNGVWYATGIFGRH